jgi:aminoglycoside phosphotransferase (APT) family kinase protein
VYTVLQAPFVPRLLGWEDHPDFPLMLLEDLSRGTWPPPWTPERVNSVRDTLRTVAATTPPASLPSQERYREVLSGWRRVAQNPEPFLQLAVASRGWLDEALPVLLEASSQAVLEGDSLVHYDVRSDNICFLEDRTVFLDWSGACRGNPVLDLVGWLPSLALEGGPAPDTVVGDEVTDLVALVSGYWAAQAGFPPPEGAPRVRDIQLAQLTVALPWAARLLRLPPPDGTVT